MHTRTISSIFVSRTILSLAACGLLAAAVLPGSLAAQEFPRDSLDEALDDLATERAQDLNTAYYEYEAALEEARREAERLDEPELYTERRAELRSRLEQRVLRIERNYERRRADVLLEHTGRRPPHRDDTVERRFDRPGAERDERGDAPDRPRFDEPIEDRPGVGRNRLDYRMAELEDELAQAWAEFHRRAQEARERARENDDWDGYEDTITRLENEYQETIADIQGEQRRLQFEKARERAAAARDTAFDRDRGRD